MRIRLHRLEQTCIEFEAHFYRHTIKNGRLFENIPFKKKGAKNKINTVLPIKTWNIITIIPLCRKRR